MDDSKVCKIALTQGYFATVDADDYEELNRYKWYVKVKANGCYAYRTQGGKQIAMHRQILKAPACLQCDHVNGNGLDNRKANLRLCTPQQNAYNRKPLERTSKYKGVCWERHRRRWRADIEHNGQHICIGYFDYEQDAAIAYDDYAAELFGEFAYLNCAHRPEIEDWLTQTRLFEFDSRQGKRMTCANATPANC